MAFDGVFLAGICQELNTKILGGRVDKIYQPDSTSIIFTIRAQSFNHQLHISSNPVFCRIHLTKAKKINPIQPPVFCMVLRKHLTGGKILAIEQPGLERLLEIKFSCFNELGDLEEKNLICEIMGKHSNLILLKENKEIIDSIKKIGHSTNRYREILPGRPYLTPPAQDKLALTNVTEDQVADVVMTATDNTKLTSLLVSRFQGISPLLANELIYRCGFPLTITAEVCGLQEIRMIFQSLSALAQMINTGSFTPCFASAKKNPIAFSSLKLTHLGGVSLKFPTNLNETADEFYQAKEAATKLKQLSSSLSQKVLQEIGKLQSKLKVQQEDLIVAEKRQEDRIKGQLITANIYQISPRQETITVINYFEPEAPMVTVALDPGLSPSANAQRYFKRYNKSKKAIEMLTELIYKVQQEIAYLESILNNIDQVKNTNELEEIKQELIGEKYLPLPKQAGKKSKDLAKPVPHEFKSTSGFVIFVGKNNNQNDWLTLKIGKENDIWLHAKNIPGAHVLIKTEGQQVPESTIYQGALLAAYFSKNRNSNQTPVDYTLKKHVKKPGGAKPGMVIYANEKTVYTKASDPWLDSLGLED